MSAQTDLTIRDYFAAHAPECPEWYMTMCAAIDKNKNQYNEPHKPPLRENIEIIACWNYEYADSMLKVRGGWYVQKRIRK